MSTHNFLTATMNTSDNSSDSCFPVTSSGLVVSGGIGGIIMCLNVLVFAGLLLSKSIAEQIRIPLLTLCVSDCLYAVPLVLWVVSRQLCFYISVLVAFAVGLSYTVIFLISVDRGICLYFETLYMKYVTNKRVRVMYVIVWIIVAFLTYFGIGNHNSNKKVFFDMATLLVFSSKELFVQILTMMFSVGTLLKIRYIQTRTPKIKEDFRNTVKLLYFIHIYQLMVIPSLVHRLIWATRPDLTDSLKTFRRVSVVMMSCCGIMKPLLFILLFNECRLSILQIVCWWNKTVSSRIEYKKKQLLAPFLTVRRSERDTKVSDPLPHIRVFRIEMAQENQSVQVIDVLSPTSRPQTLITVNPPGE